MAAKKSGLGKGLDSLIPEKAGATAAKGKAAVEGKDILLVDINKVEPNPDQPRKNFDEDRLIELSENIKQHGIMNPLIVLEKKDYYMIIGGERRWRASKMAGLKKIPVIVKKDLTEQQVAEWALIDNIQREDLNQIDQAEAYQKLLNDYNWTQDKLAEVVSKSRTAVTNSLRLLKLDPRVRQMVIDEMVSAGHARALLGVTDGEKQFTLAQQIYDEKMSVRDTEKLVKKLQSQKETTEKQGKNKNPQLEAIYAEQEEKMKQLFGTKVTISQKNEKSGKIEIEYYSPEELEHLLEMLYTIKK